MPLPRHFGTVRTIEPQGTLAEAAKIMVRDQVGAVLIRKDADSPVEGILTDRDIVKEIAGGEDPAVATVARFAKRKITTVSEDASRRDITRKMRSHGVRRIPLTDAEGNVTGIVSLDDLVFDLGGELFDLSHAIETELRHETPYPEPDL